MIILRDCVSLPPCPLMLAHTRTEARQLNRTILYEVAPRKDGGQGQCDDAATAVEICHQTRNYFERNVVRAELTGKDTYSASLLPLLGPKAEVKDRRYADG